MVIICMINSLFAYSVAAATGSSVTVHFVGDSGEGIPNVHFSVYRIAELPNREHEFRLCAPFSSYPIAVPNKETTALWEDFAVTLRGYISRDKIGETAKGTTDSSGNLVFSTEDPIWQTGLYLLLGEPVTVDSTIVTPQPSFFPVSGDENESLLVEPKHSNTPTNPDPPGSLEITVVKNGGEAAQSRSPDLLMFSY